MYKSDPHSNMTVFDEKSTSASISSLDSIEESSFTEGDSIT